MTQRRTRSWTSTVDVLAPHELTEDDRTLLEAAHDAAKHAYAPYSGFHVGGAVRLACGTIVKGSNQENMAYPSGMCGERVAVFAAGAQHPGTKMTAVAIVSPSEKAIPEGFMPCGGCRQVLVEAERRQDQNPEDPLAGARRRRDDLRERGQLDAVCIRGPGVGARRGRHLTRGQASLLTNNRSHTFRLKVWSEAP